MELFCEGLCGYSKFRLCIHSSGSYPIFEMEPSQQKIGSGNFVFLQTRFVFKGRKIDDRVIIRGGKSLLNFSQRLNIR